MKFIITVDTEGDNPWAGPREITTANANYLPRFQSLCESYGFGPTYLTTYEMAICPKFQQFGKDLVRRNMGEIGMHCHAWNSPPIIPLTPDDFLFHPYLTEFPEELINQKVAFLTNLLRDTFEVDIVSHRAGRWGLNEIHARILVDYGYRIDCSITPCISWENFLGDPAKSGGPDFSGFPNEAYFLDLEDISQPGSSPLLEIPVTTVRRCNVLTRNICHRTKRIPLLQAYLRRLVCGVAWLRPSVNNLSSMLHIFKQAVRERRIYIELVIHSCDLMPGGSPYFPVAEDIDKLYDDLEVLFSEIANICSGATLSEYYDFHTSLLVPYQENTSPVMVN